MTNSPIPGGAKMLPSEVKSLTSEEWAFIAGIVEGEGSITAQTQTHRGDGSRGGGGKLRVWITISQVNPALLHWLEERLGGKVYIRRYRRGEHQRVSGQWVSTRMLSTVEILQNCLPYLVGKRTQALVGLRIMARRPGEDLDRWSRILTQLKHQKFVEDSNLPVRPRRKAA